MPNQDPELTVLLHESEQVTALIERSQTVANALFGAVLPAAGAFLLFAARGEEIQIPPQFLGVFFAAIVTLALIFNAGLWFEITRYLRYKYLILYPRIYAVAGLEDKENLGHFLAVEHLKQRDFLGTLFQTVLPLMTVTVSAFGIVTHTEGCLWQRAILLGLLFLFLAIAVAANLYLGKQVQSTFREVAADSPLRRLAVGGATADPEAEKTPPP